MNTILLSISINVHRTSGLRAGNIHVEVFATEVNIILTNAKKGKARDSHLPSPMGKEASLLALNVGR